MSRTQSPENQEDSRPTQGMLGIREIKPKESEELREVLQTVAQPGEKGGSVRCVVSVGMLTEGWDCQRVTHILGYRLFGSQLLCEQTMGRALRRRDYENTQLVKRREDGICSQRFPADYAVVFGVPFEQLREGDSVAEQIAPKPTTTVSPVPERTDEMRIWIPDFKEYGVARPSHQPTLDRKTLRPIPEEAIAEAARERMAQAESDIREVEAAGPIGEAVVLKADPKAPADHVEWELASELTEKLRERIESEDPKTAVKRASLFGSCLKIIREWLTLEEDIRGRFSHEDLASENLRDIVISTLVDAISAEGTSVERQGVPRDPDRPMRSASDWEPFNTALRDVVPLRRSELDHAACHSGLEARIAERLERSPRVASFVRNFGPQEITIPYQHQGAEARYVPDFFVRLRQDGDGPVVHVVLEGKGVQRDRDRSKARWTDHWWIPCANTLGRKRRQVWIRREIDSERAVEAALKSAAAEATASWSDAEAEASHRGETS